MPELNRLLSENLGIAFLAVASVLLLVLLLMIVQSIRLGRARSDYRALVRDVAGGSLEEVLSRHIERVEAVDRRLSQMDQLYGLVEGRSRGSLQHIGLVRFNPFEDTGSDQSFAIALLDDRRDGIVISSLHGRSVTRVFAKPVENGGSRHNLSDEETRAIRIAVEGTRPSEVA